MTDKELEEFEKNKSLADTIENIDNDIIEFNKLKNSADFRYKFEELNGDINAISFEYEKSDVITRDMLNKAFLNYLNTIKESLI